MLIMAFAYIGFYQIIPSTIHVILSEAKDLSIFMCCNVDSASRIFTQSKAFSSSAKNFML